MNYKGSLVRTLYISTSGKYLKLKIRLDKARQSGRFYTLSKRKQHSLVQRLIRLFEKLKSLQTQLRLSGIGAAIALAMSATPALAQSSLGPFSKEDLKNPLPPPTRIAVPKPASVDIDNDGDLDVFVGDKYGNIRFFKNTAGKDVVRRLAEVSGDGNPLGFVSIGSSAAPAFIDADGDGDFDLLSGTYSGTTHFFRNTGTASAPQFVEETGSTNPFDGVIGSLTKYGNYGPALPTFADIDGDADVDLVIGSSYYNDGGYSYASAVVIYYNNSGEFVRDSFGGEFSNLNYATNRSLTFVDLDGDNNLDILSGTRDGGVEAFLWDGSTFVEQSGFWVPSTNTGNPFYNTYIGSNGWINLADLDDDGDLDALIGSGSNYAEASDTEPIVYFENTGDFVYVRREGLNLSHFDGVDVDRQATPSFTDIDGDGDLDAVLGSKYTRELLIYKNTEGSFFLDPEDALTDVNMSYQTLPVFVDIDGDGDQDLFVTSGYSSLKFLENDGNTFVETSSPLDLSYFGDPSLAFIDIDNDEDLDAFVFNRNTGAIEFFSNTGDAQNPDFQSEATPAPFDDLVFEDVTKITSVDMDHDGDLDLIASESLAGKYTYYSQFRFFDNNGSGSFSELPSSIFDEPATRYSFLNFGDIDNDGDLDLFLGYGISYSYVRGGTVAYYENQNPSPVTSVTQNSVSILLGVPVRLDSDLTINDEDGDDIVLATVTISNFSENNEVLDFTPSAGVTGEFEDGVLTIRGKASIAEYEIILRSVTYEATGDVTAARQSARSGQPPAKTVTFSVRDTDFTATIVSVVSVITLDVTGEFGGITVYNAVSPGVTTGQNDYMRIDGLPGDNEVTIFNRWGDQVFQTTGYNNNTRRFEGKNDNGKDLPSGTYFYKIEASGKTITGYLSLRR